MPNQLHGFVLAGFDLLASRARSIPYGDLVSAVCQLIRDQPDGRCVVCNLGLNDHEWIDMSRLCEHYPEDAKQSANETRDVEVPNLLVPVRSEL